MFKKIPFVLIAILFFTPLIFASDETLTITTYYPSPYGSYNELSTNLLRYGEKSSAPFACDSTHEGATYYQSTVGSKGIFLCNGSDWVKLGGISNRTSVTTTGCWWGGGPHTLTATCPRGYMLIGCILGIGDQREYGEQTQTTPDFTSNSCTALFYEPACNLDGFPYSDQRITTVCAN